MWQKCRLTTGTNQARAISNPIESASYRLSCNEFNSYTFIDMQRERKKHTQSHWISINLKLMQIFDWICYMHHEPKAFWLCFFSLSFEMENFQHLNRLSCIRDWCKCCQQYAIYTIYDCINAVISSYLCIVSHAYTKTISNEHDMMEQRPARICVVVVWPKKLVC